MNLSEKLTHERQVYAIAEHVGWTVDTQEVDGTYEIDGDPSRLSNGDSLATFWGQSVTIGDNVEVDMDTGEPWVDIRYVKYGYLVKARDHGTSVRILVNMSNSTKEDRVLHESIIHPTMREGEIGHYFFDGLPGHAIGRYIDGKTRRYRERIRKELTVSDLEVTR